MSEKKLMLCAFAVAAIMVAACVIVLVKPDDSITGRYDILEYHQYSMDNGDFIENKSGDGAYDLEFIQITSCSDGVFTGYCCVPTEGEENPEHYAIHGSYDSHTGRIQYVCSYSYPESGLYDWVYGYIKDGVMQLSGFTFGDDDEYYASFQFTFIKHGCEKKHVSFEQIFDEDDEYECFDFYRSAGSVEETEEAEVSFKVLNSTNGLYHMETLIYGSSDPVDFVGAEIANDLISGIGYDENGNPFSLLISNQGSYVQVNREYTDGDGKSATWTAYLGEDQEIKEVPQFDNDSFRGTFVHKSTESPLAKEDVKMVLTSVSDRLVKVSINGEVVYGNLIPYGDGYVIAISSSIDMGDMEYYFGFQFFDKDMKSLSYSGVYVSAGELNVTYFRGMLE